MEELYKKYYKRIYGFLLTLTHNKEISEDLTQETFIQAYNSIERYNGSCKFYVWLCQIAKHLWYRYLEKHKREIPSGGIIDLNIIDMKKEGKNSIDNPYNETVNTYANINFNSPEDEYINKEDNNRLWNIIETLPQQMKDIIKLRINTELTFREIGQIYDKSENWARVTYYRTKEKLVRELRYENE